jgi:hypothetical protein
MRLVPRPTRPLNSNAVPTNLRPKDLSSFIFTLVLFQEFLSHPFPEHRFAANYLVPVKRDYR